MGQCVWPGWTRPRQLNSQASPYARPCSLTNPCTPHPHTTALQTQVVQLWGLGQLTCPWPPASPFPAAMQAAAAAAHGSSGYPHTGGQHPHGLGAPGSGIAFLNSLGLKGVPRGSVAVAGAAAPGAGVGGAAHMVVQGGVAGAGSSGGAGGAAGGDPMDVVSALSCMYGCV